MAETEQEKLEHLMARDGRVYVVRDHAQLATAVSRLKALIARIEQFTARHRLSPEETERYATAIHLLQERIRRAETIDIRLARRAEI
jgi:hypothetical protein